MAHLHRARLAFLLAVCFAGVLLIVEMPLGVLLNQRQQLARVSSELAIVKTRNHDLKSAVAALKQRSTVAAIAHQDYGLVRPGQQSYVVLPGASDTAGAANSLLQRPLPAASLVPGDVNSLLQMSSVAAHARDGVATTGGLWNRVLDRLAFWRWSL